MTGAPDVKARTDFLLCSLRVLSLDLKLGANQADTVGVALRSGLIDEREAFAWLDEVGLLPCLPVKVRITA